MTSAAAQILTLNVTDTPVIRTYFGEGSSNEKYEKLVEAHKQKTSEGFLAYISALNDKACDGLDREKLMTPEFAECYPRKEGFALLADKRSFEDETLLVVNLCEEEEGGEASLGPNVFRVIPSETWGPQNNLSIANMDFADFAEAAEEGVFRGFPPPPDTANKGGSAETKQLPAKTADNDEKQS